MPPRIAIVGLRFGKTWARCAAGHPRAELAGLCDVQRDVLDACADEVGAPTRYDRIDQVLADDRIDCVGLFTPAPGHADQSIAALEAGKHVLCAVPAAGTVEECRQLVDAVERSGKVYMMAENWPYTPSIMRAKQLYGEGKFGRIFYGEAEYLHDLRGYWYDSAGRATWRRWRHPLFYPTHGTGPIVHMTGERFVEVTAHESNGDTDDHPHWLQAAMLRLEGGALFKLMNSFRNAHPGGHYFSFYGDQGSFETGRFRDTPKVAYYWFDGMDEHKLVREECAQERVASIDDFQGAHAGTSALITDDFVAAVLGEQPSPIDVHMAVDMTLPGICAIQSIEEGRTVEIPDLSQ